MALSEQKKNIYKKEYLIYFCYKQTAMEVYYCNYYLCVRRSSTTLRIRNKDSKVLRKK